MFIKYNFLITVSETYFFKHHFRNGNNGNNKETNTDGYKNTHVPDEYRTTGSALYLLLFANRSFYVKVVPYI
jgi:hypothetical protein